VEHHSPSEVIRGVALPPPLPYNYTPDSLGLYT